MKFTKLSLAALIAMGVTSSAFAIENVKVDGQLKLWYQTSSVSEVAGDAATAAAQSEKVFATLTGAQKASVMAKEGGLFQQKSSVGDLVAKLRATGDLTKKVGFGTVLYAASTMGLENNLVAEETLSLGTSNGGGAGTTSGDNNWPVWLGEAYFTYKAGNTIAKIGRQELDTPLAFSETWNAAPNTFEAAVLVNNDLPQTTIVAAYVARGNGNGSSTVGTKFNQYGAPAGLTAGEFGAGAYALGLVNKSIPGLTIHPVYYDVVDIAQAYWIDMAYTGLPYGIKIEGLYAGLNASGDQDKALQVAGVTDRKTDGYAFKLSGAVAGVNLGASYSNVSAGSLPIANTATGFTKTKIYTASILSDGRIAAQPDVSAWKLEASTKLAGFDLGASYASYDVKENNGGTRITGYTLSKDKSPSELDLSVGTKIDDVNLTAYYIMQNDYTVAGTANEARDRQAIRVIASINF